MLAVVMTIATRSAVLLQEHSSEPPSSGGPPRVELEALASLLFYLLILIVVFLFGSYAILRASRRFRASLTTRRPRPTDASDVWAMHKQPDSSRLEDDLLESDDQQPNGHDEDDDESKSTGPADNA